MNKLLKIYNESNDITEYQIFCDMDGCLCDLAKQFKTCIGQDIDGFEDKYGKDAFWQSIEKTGLDFWTKMDWMPDGQELWNYIAKYNPTILSAPSRDKNCIIGKVQWLKDHIKLPNYDLQLKAKGGWDGKSKIILNSDKFRYVSSNKDILIDDTPKKIDAWVKAGGIGILHKNTTETIKHLKELRL